MRGILLSVAAVALAAAAGCGDSRDAGSDPSPALEREPESDLDPDGDSEAGPAGDYCPTIGEYVELTDRLLRRGGAADVDASLLPRFRGDWSGVVPTGVAFPGAVDEARYFDGAEFNLHVPADGHGSLRIGAEALELPVPVDRNDPYLCEGVGVGEVCPRTDGVIEGFEYTAIAPVVDVLRSDPGVAFLTFQIDLGEPWRPYCELFDSEGAPFAINLPCSRGFETSLPSEAPVDSDTHSDAPTSEEPYTWQAASPCACAHDGCTAVGGSASAVFVASEDGQSLEASLGDNSKRITLERSP